MINGYPYISMINKFNDQYIIEGCSLENNFKIILKYDHLFDEEKIELQKTNKNMRNKIYSFFDLYMLYDINYSTLLTLYQGVL